MKRLLLVTLLSLAVLGMTPRPAEGAERPRVAATRALAAVRIDGVLGESDWQRAPPIDAFRLIQVREGEAPSESTDVRVLFDDTHLFFGIRCDNRGPGAIRASLAPRDGILDDDHISVHLDTYRDLHRAYIFGVNPYGVQLDGILDGQEPDFNWDGVWQAETRRSPTGWIAEIAVPLRTLRFPSRGPGTWGLWFRRQITKNDEVCSWPLWRQAEQGDIMLQAGDLVGLEGLRGGGGLEVQPYASSTGSFRRRPSSSLGDGELGPWSRNHEMDVGLDLKYALTSTLLANGTLNPDYSQIEADALQVDVNQRFPLFFPEKRPFFLEGAEIFSTPYRFVYTRRMADPAFGAKLIGTQGHWRLGAIAVRDDGGGSTEGIGARSDQSPADRGWFTIGRAAYDLGENNRLGLLATDHASEPDRLGPLEARGSGHSTLIAADARLRFARSLFFAGQLAGTRTTLDSVSSGGRDRFSDHAYSGALWWADGVRYLQVYQDYLGPDLRAEAGFLDRVDIRNTGYDANVIFRPENRWLRFIQPRSNGDMIRDHQGVLQENRIAGAIDWGFQQQTFLTTRLARVEERWLSRVYDRTRYIVVLENTLWRPLALSLMAVLEDGIFYAPTDSASFLGWQETWELGATARPWPWLTSELAATRSHFTHSRGGEELYDLWLLGAKTTWQFTRRLYARLYPQYDTGADHLDLDALIGYVVHPGSVLYLGFSSDLDKLGPRHRATQGTVFLKASYRFQR
jgi:uncharacterized protein DUF5916/cellulose/xylan binding protein with CBM9 domain